MGALLQSKFQLACAAFLAALGLVVFHQMTPEQWVSFNTWLMGLYFSAQVAESAVAKQSPVSPG